MHCCAALPSPHPLRRAACRERPARKRKGGRRTGSGVRAPPGRWVRWGGRRRDRLHPAPGQARPGRAGRRKGPARAPLPSPASGAVTAEAGRLPQRYPPPREQPRKPEPVTNPWAQAERRGPAPPCPQPGDAWELFKHWGGRGDDCGRGQPCAPLQFVKLT